MLQYACNSQITFKSFMSLAIRIGGKVKTFFQSSLALLLAFSLLILLEIFFWHTKLNKPFRRLNEWQTRKTSLGFYLFPNVCILRLIVILLITFFVLFENVGYLGLSKNNFILSFVAGSFLGFFAFFGLLKRSAVSLKKGLNGFKTLFSENRLGFIVYSFFLLLCGGLVEELIFRGFFVSVCAEIFGILGIVVASVINIIWHLPAWHAYSKEPEVHVVPKAGSPVVASLKYASQVFPFVLILSVLFYFTNNLVGPIVAHFLSDYAGYSIRKIKMNKTPY